MPLPRILLLFEYPTLLGGERSLAVCLERLRGQFHFLALAPGGGELVPALDALGIEHHAPPWEGNASQETKRAVLAEELGRLAPALVHSNSLAMARLAGPVCRELQIASLGHLRDLVNLSSQATADVASNPRLLAVSHAVARHHTKQGIPADRMHVLYNGVERPTPRFATRAELVHNAGWPADLIDAQWLIAMGQIGPRKGLDILLEALASVLPGRPNWHLLLIGQRYSQKEESRAFEARLHAQTQAAGLLRQVHFLGSYPEGAQVLLHADLLVHAARQEPFGRVLLEAAAAGLCVLATRVGGTEEIFPPERDLARLVTPGDPRELAECLETLLDAPQARQRLGVAAREYVLNRFSVAAAAEGLLQHYQAVLERQRC